MTETGPREAWVDGEVGVGALISPYDLGWQQGVGLFETLGVFGGRLPLWERHLERMARSSQALGLTCSEPGGLKDAALELLSRNAGDDVLRITLSAGSQPRWVLTTRARPSGAGEPLMLCVDPVPRAAEDPLAAIKCTSYAGHFLARRRAQASGADDAILVDTGGRVLETSTANLFLVVGGEIRTPSPGAFLPGVGRAVVLAGLRDRGAPVQEVDITVAEVRAADAIFLTNAVHGPRPAALLDGRAPQPVPGAVLEAWRAGTAE